VHPAPCKAVRWGEGFGDLLFLCRFFLNRRLLPELSGVEEYNLGDLNRGFRGINPAFETSLYQLGDETAVVEMGVRQKDGSTLSGSTPKSSHLRDWRWRS
jgi:hypothetical protein